jgi:hypothetical protein
MGAWTYGSLMEDVEDIGREAGPTVLNPYDVGAERARASFPAHRLNGALIWEVPVGQKPPIPGRHALGARSRRRRLARVESLLLRHRPVRRRVSASDRIFRSRR